MVFKWIKPNFLSNNSLNTQRQKNGHGKDLYHSNCSPFLRQIKPVTLVADLSLHNLQSTDMELYAWGLQVQALYRTNLFSSTLRLRNHIYFWIANDHEISFLINYIENTFFLISRRSLGYCFFSSFNTQFTLHLFYVQLDGIRLQYTFLSILCIYVKLWTVKILTNDSCWRPNRIHLISEEYFSLLEVYDSKNADRLVWLEGSSRDNGLLTQYSNQDWKQYWVSSIKPLVFQSKYDWFIHRICSFIIHDSKIHFR